MKNNIIVVLLVVLIGIMSGLGLLFGINNAVQNAVQAAVLPLYEKVNEVSVSQKSMDTKLNGINASFANINKRLNQAPQPQPQAAARPQPPSEDLNKVYDIPVGASVIVGKKDAPITIVQFTDLQCPFCSRFYPPVKETLKAYPDKVRFMIKNYPLGFHPNARPAAKLSLAAAEQGKYIEMVELLLENKGEATEAKIKEYAKTLGIKEAKLLADLKANDAKYEAQINDETALGEKVDVRGTPTFFLNGKKTNSRDAAGFKTEIDQILGAK